MREALVYRSWQARACEFDSNVGSMQDGVCNPVLNVSTMPKANQNVRGELKRVSGQIRLDSVQP